MKVTALDFRQRLLPILGAQAVGLACGLAGVHLASRLVAPADYGAYGVFVSLALIGASVVYAGLVKFVSRHWQAAPDRAGLRREILAAVRRKTPWLLGAVAVTAGLAAPAQPLVYGVMLFACALLLTLTQLAQSALQATREHWRDLGISAGGSVTRSFLPPLLYALAGPGLLPLLAGFLGHAVVTCALAAWQLRPWSRAPAGAAPTLTAVYDGPQFVALALAGWMLAGVNRWLVAWFFGAETAGYFTLAGNIGMILPTMLGMVLLQYVQPHWFTVAPEDPAARRRLLWEVDRVAAVYTGLALLLAAGLQAGMPLLIGPVVSARYTPAVSFVLVNGCFATAAMIGIFYHSMLVAARRERACVPADLGGAACLIAGGIAGAALAGTAGFKLWLLVSPVAPWLVNRTLARRALLRDAAPAG